MTLTEVDKAKVAEAEEWVRQQHGEILIEFTEGYPPFSQRRYLVNGKKWPSVTTILDKHIAKDGLKYWYEQMTYAGCAALIDGIDPEDREAKLATYSDPQKLSEAVYSIGETPGQIAREAAVAGTVIHDALERWAKHGEVPDLSKLDLQRRAKMQSLIRFLSEHRPDIVQSEVLVASLRHHYAGRYDAIAEFPEDFIAPVEVTADGRTEIRVCPAGSYLLDVKTGKSIHQDHGLQLALYEQASIECGYEPTDHRACLHLTEQGYALRFFDTVHPADATLAVDLYHAFLRCNEANTSFHKKLPIPETILTLARLNG